MRKQKGITLIALVVTVIVLLILAAVSITALTDEDKGVVTKAKTAAQKTEDAAKAEDDEIQEILDYADSEWEDNSDDTTYYDTEFSTAYADIDIVWLDTSNSVISSPNAPVVGSLTPIKYSGTTEVTTTSSDSAWYSYVKGSGTTENTSSKWANAKDSSGNYFVWIPRFAYRIIYYADSSKTTVSGYSDGRGIVDVNGTSVYSLDSGIQTITYSGNSYIVHPAFETNLEVGGWSSDIAGFWVGKYETNGDTQIKPGVASNSATSISDMFTNAKSFLSSMNSHMMKNSEWGAVAYLTWSEYGKNGHEIDMNNNASYYTGYGAGSTNATTTDSSYAYNTTQGQGASSTGNIYGVYDLSGGCVEYVAAFNNTDTNGWEASYGSSFAGTSNSSTKYATKYYNSGTVAKGSGIYSVGKTGDATKEVYSGTSPYSLNGDFSVYVCSTNPFFIRGGSVANGSGTGIFYLHNFCSGWGNGGASDRSYRIILCQ